MIKIDPYMNIDAGTMAPTEHGECFVLGDGGETDLDLGNYERYLNITLSRDHNITTGKIYQHVIEKERRGDYLGKTVQIVPHLTDALQDWLIRVARLPVDETKEQPDLIQSSGGTVGDIENAPFVEALRQLRRKAGAGNFLHIHVSMIPVINEEQKTKPTQQTIKDVRSAGLNPDLIACRCKDELMTSTIEKVAMFCQVETEQVVAVHDVPSTYHVPLVLEKQDLIASLTKILNLDQLESPSKLRLRGATTWEMWKTSTSIQESQQLVTIALVGKYTSFADSYISVIKSLEHSAMFCKRKLNLIMVDSSNLEEESSKSSLTEYRKAWDTLRKVDGILVPGGFGTRGTEGMIAATRWARTNKVPFLGVCLGMQIAVIEYARSVCMLTSAGSQEFNAQVVDPVIIFMPEIDSTSMGATMRLGMRPTHFQPGTEWSQMRRLYRNSPVAASKDTIGGLIIHERHRHRYEVNPAYVSKLASHGLNFVGKDDKGERMEISELKDHPWFVGVQFHPEYLSKVLEPSRPYLGFFAASAGCLDEVMERLESGKGALGS
ncbi:hypothetical protein ACEPPN_003561 [Leptodophora sp. 'Broadleaf-Isolate-01']